MLKKIAYAVTGLIVFSPLAASAQTLADVEAQLQSALTQLQALIGQGTVLGASTGPLPDDYGNGSNAIYCPSLSQTLQRGARDATTVPPGQVTELQTFLSSYYDDYPDDGVTGFFGNNTKRFVIRFQREQGLPFLGIVGSLTRAKIAEVCAGGRDASGGDGRSTGANALIASPTYGSAPLVVSFSHREIPPDNFLDFGDGSPLDTSGGKGGWANHRYVSPGTYEVILRECTLHVSEKNCDASRIIGSATITVTSSTNAPTITVVYPNGGEQLENSGAKDSGTIANITWTSNNNPVGAVDISLVNSEGRVVKTLAAGMRDMGSYTWHYDSSIPDGKYKILVSTSDKGPSAQDYSDGFFMLSLNPGAMSCSILQQSQKYYFDICRSNGFDNVCFNKYSGAYQGCSKSGSNDCTTNNTNADKNVLCSVGGERGALNFTAEPHAGDAPLTVSFTHSGEVASDIKIAFGDGASGGMNPAPICATCTPQQSATHTYTTPGSYLATISANGQSIGAILITVTSPNGGSQAVITNIAPAYGGSGDTITIYGSGFTAKGTPTVDFLQDGVVKASMVYPSVPYVTETMLQFKIDGIFAANVALGTYQVRYSNSGVTSNTINFTLQGPSNSTNLFDVQPVGGSAPVTSTATFSLASTCTAYTLTWGDGTNDNYAGPGEPGCTGPAITRTKSHTFTRGGTYTVTFQAAGLAAQTKSVVVTEAPIISPPTVSLLINGQSSVTVPAGQNFMVAWSSSNATSCAGTVQLGANAATNWGGIIANASGSSGGGAPAAGTTYTYTLSCTNAGGTTTKSASITGQ